MNERIKELACQIGTIATIGNWGRVEWSDNVYPQLGDKMYADIDLQKFAELIVRECANVAAEHEALDIYEEIREHFGVEE